MRRRSVGAVGLIYLAATALIGGVGYGWEVFAALVGASAVAFSMGQLWELMRDGR